MKNLLNLPNLLSLLQNLFIIVIEKIVNVNIWFKNKL